MARPRHRDREPTHMFYYGTDWSHASSYVILRVLPSRFCIIRSVRQSVDCA